MTLKDIADKAGVSMMTVSNVIHKKNNRVSAKTIEKVNAIIKEYGYVPNLNARSLSNKTSNIIGIILPITRDGQTANYLENPYISTMIGTIEQELRYSGYYTMVRSISQESDINLLLINWSVDGIIFLYPDFDDHLEQFINTVSIPIAVFDSSLDLPELINIRSDDSKGLYLSTRFMVNHGHTHIAFAAQCEGHHILEKRLNGYRRALNESGIPFRCEYVLAYPPTYEGGIAAGKQIAAMGSITAAVTTADICAIGIMEGARLGGLRIPGDLSVAGYDNLSLCQYTVPKLTSISQDIPQKARLATQLLLEKIRTGKTKQPCHITMDVDIVERQSVISLF